MPVTASRPRPDSMRPEPCPGAARIRAERGEVRDGDVSWIARMNRLGILQTEGVWRVNEWPIRGGGDHG